MAYISVFSCVAMNGSYLALKDELVVGIDDDGLKLRICRHQTQIALFFCGEVYLLHCQPSVDEGHHDITIRNLLRTVCKQMSPSKSPRPIIDSPLIRTKYEASG